MKIEWNLRVSFGGKPHTLKATLEYHSNQIMRIRVQGRLNDLLLENNYPALMAANSKKGVQWKIREGQLTQSTPETARLLMNIFQQLEGNIKNDFPY